MRTPRFISVYGTPLNLLILCLNTNCGLILLIFILLGNFLVGIQGDKREITKIPFMRIFKKKNILFVYVFNMHVFNYAEVYLIFFYYYFLNGLNWYIS